MVGPGKGASGGDYTGWVGSSSKGAAAAVEESRGIRGEGPARGTWSANIGFGRIFGRERGISME